MAGHDELNRISEELGRLREEIEHVGASDAKVLISGRDIGAPHAVARSIHQRSVRSLGPFVRVSCAGMSDASLASELFGHVPGTVSGASCDKRGSLEIAHEGTVFLEGVDHMPERVQLLFTRFLETGEVHKVGAATPTRRVNVRVIAAAQPDLYDRVREGRFREDLFYRLNMIHIVVAEPGGTA
jgi:transcriptional regulator with PAS, ATPase and Fis domain